MASYTLEFHDELREKVFAGTITIAEFLTAFAALVEQRELVEAQLTQRTIKQLVGRNPHRYKKAGAVEATYRRMCEFFILGTRGYTLGHSLTMLKDYTAATIAAITPLVEAMTQQDLTDYYETRSAKVASIMKAITNPETLEEFRVFERRHKRGALALNPEQLAIYDVMRADLELEKQEREDERRTAILRLPDDDYALELLESWHTKHQKTVWVVRMTTWVTRELYLILKQAAQRLGGRYSSYDKDGAIPGFLFWDADDAQAFIDLQDGDGSALARWRRYKEILESRAVDRLNDIANRLETGGDEELNRDRRTNTKRRVDMARNAEARALENIRMATTMRNLAAAVNDGRAKYLSGVRFKADIETFELVLHSAQWAYARSLKDEDYSAREEAFHREPSLSDVQGVKYPYPHVNLSFVHTIADELKDVPGFRRVSKKLAKVEGKDGLNYVTFRHTGYIEALRRLLAGYRGRNTYTVRWIKASYMDWVRVKRMGLTTLPLLRAALREYLEFRTQAGSADPIREMMRDLVGWNLPGYYPTPSDHAANMVRLAEVTMGDRGWEPNGGHGAIADEMRAAGCEPDVCEINTRLQKILVAKGYNLVGGDMTEYRDGEGYDVIVMNPPFANGEDAIHIAYAYNMLLKPGGRLVAAMSANALTGSRYTAFRLWFEKVDGDHVDDIPPGAFKWAGNNGGTGVGAIVVRLVKG